MTPDGAAAPRRLFLLDGHSLAYRAFFALPQTLATSSGTVTNAVYGFTSMLIKLLADESPDLIAVAFDMGPPTIRLELDAEYKAGRAEAPAEFRPQLGLIEEVLDALKIPPIRPEGHEADDAIGTLALQASQGGIDAVIVTADRDFFQLVRDRVDGRGAVSVLFNRRGISEIDLMDPLAIEARYGVRPDQYLDFVALKGDTSDNIPGVPGVGDKTAAKLVQEYGTVEELLAHVEDLKGKLKENVAAAADRLALNKQLARIVTDVALEVGPEDCSMGAWDHDQVRQLFGALEFRSLLDRLSEVVGTEPKVEVAELDLEQTTVTRVAEILGRGDVAVRLHEDDAHVSGIAVSAGGAQAAYAPLDGLVPLADVLSDTRVAKWAHDGKELERTARQAGIEIGGSRSTPCWRGTCWTRPRPTTRCATYASATWGPTSWGWPRMRPRGSCSPRTRGGSWRRKLQPWPCSRRSSRRRSTSRACAASSKTWSSRSRRSWHGWRLEVCVWTSTTSRRWGSPSATGWPR